MEGVEIAGTAENGLKALELILALEPDVVILDIVMPKLNGIDVLKRVHDSDMKKRPRFIVLSAMDQDDLTQQALELGAECYITKPFDMEALVDRIIKGSFAQT
jgi:Response regulator containing CheY-like receiver domain and AraC-type DNA-binding domain